MSPDVSTSNHRVLIIEDEPAMVAGLRDAFEHNGFSVDSSPDGQAGMELALSSPPDVIILDLMLPRKDGMEVCRELRARNVWTPIIMLTARGGETDRVSGFDMGADDYVTKPFSVQELIARTRALLRRAGGTDNSEGRVQVGEAIVDFKQYVVLKGNQRQILTPIEVSLIRLFIGHPHEVITRDRLLNEVWGFNSYPTTRTIDTFLLRLRTKIESNPRRPVHFITVHGAGYKFVP